MVPKVSAPISRARIIPSLVWLHLLWLALLSYFVWAPTIAPYFLSDDFLHLNYLDRVCHGEPWLLLDNFKNTWLGDRSFFNFFRPLVEVSLAFDYLTGKGSPLTFHLTAVLLHFSNSLLVYFIAGNLTKTKSLTALTAASLFAVAPNHCETVAWILSRSDLLVTFFYLASILAFLKADSQSENKDRLSSAFSLLSCLGLVFSLLCKEAAISLPFVLLALSLSRGTAYKNARFHSSNFFIALLYLAWRSFSIGSLYGGYSGSLGELLSSSLGTRWFESEALFQVFHPFNLAYFDKSHLIRLVSRITWFALGLCVLINIKRLEEKQATFLFLLFWTVFSLLPSLQILGVNAYMSGSRIVYLSAAPFMIFLALLLETRQLRVSSAVYRTALLSLFITMTWAAKINNQAWLEAGRTIEKLQRDLVSLVEIDRNTKVVVFDLPQNINGAHCFAYQGILQGMLKPPVTAKDLSRQVIALDFQPLFDGFIDACALQEALQHKENYRVYRYDRRSEKFISYEKPISKKEYSTIEASFKASKAEEASFISLYYDLKAACDLNSLLGIGVKDLKPKKKTSLYFAWPDDPDHDYSAPFLPIKANEKKDLLYMPISDYRNWLASEKLSLLRMTMPKELYEVRAEPTIALQPLSAVSPRLVAEEADNAHLNRVELRQEIALNWDATAMNLDCDELWLEGGEKYVAFNHYTRLSRDDKPLKKAHLKVRLKAKKGRYILKAVDFPESGWYQLRVLPIKDGRPCGLASNAVIVFKD